MKSNERSAAVKPESVKERPIIFSGESVRAILEGRKTQTRRVVKLPRWAEPGQEYEFEIDDKPGQGQGAQDWPFALARVSGCLAAMECPSGVPGDRLWVKETWVPVVDADPDIPGWHEWEAENPNDTHDEPDAILYKATDDHYPERWRDALFMPRKFSRLTLEIIKVRVEQLQDMSEEDAIAEGIKLAPTEQEWTGTERSGMCHRGRFAVLWDSLNAKRGYSWESNCWVWVLEFKVCTEGEKP